MKPKLIALALVVVLSGCFGGSKNRVIMVEPGSVVEVVDDKPVNVEATVTDDKGVKEKVVAKENIAGSVAMPKSVYRKMRTAYIALYDFVNGKIDSEELDKRLKENACGKAETDQK